MSHGFLRASTRRRRLRLELLEERRQLSAVPLGAMPQDTGEFMLGSVAVTPVLLESNGLVDPSTEDWTADEIDAVLDNVAEGMQWWVDTLANFGRPETDEPWTPPVHTLEFVIDETFATTPVESPYEPITRPSDAYSQYVGAFLSDQGYDGGSLTLEEAMRDFNHQQRLKHETNWAFTIFVVDSSNDSDDMFDPSGSFLQAFGFAGGLFFVTPSARPASTYAHETGHMFWARDEYPNSGHYTDQRGYYNAQNTNAVDGAPDGFVQEPSIMTAGTLLQEAYFDNTSADSTLAQVGWRDSDEDGIFDLLDVPLSLDVAGFYDQVTGQLQLRGRASAVPLVNQNSSGLRNDITLNEVSRIEYRVDGGSWQTLLSPQQQSLMVDVAMVIEVPEESLEVRAIDSRSGVTSPIVSVPLERPTAGYGWSLDAFAFADDNDNGQYDPGEYLVPGVAAELVDPIGIVAGRVEPDETPGVVYDDSAPVQLQSEGNTVDGRVAAFSGEAATGTHLFQAGSIFGGFTASWTEVRQELVATFDEPTSDVSIVAIGQESGSVGRLEALDADGHVIDRFTSAALQPGETALLRVHDPEGRIASVKAFGAARTDVGLDDLRYGPAIATSSSTFGAFGLKNLPPASYQLALASSSSQFEVIDPNVTIEIGADDATTLAVPLRRLTSPWTNPSEPLDVNDNGVIQPLDALVVINELNRSEARELTDDDLTPPYFDVNGDRSITPIDALRVINYLNRGSGGGEGEAGGPLDPGPGGRGGGLPPGEGERGAQCFAQLDRGDRDAAPLAGGESVGAQWAAAVDYLWGSEEPASPPRSTTAAVGESTDRRDPPQAGEWTFVDLASTWEWVEGPRRES
jgi:hypothetical protein